MYSTQHHLQCSFGNKQNYTSIETRMRLFPFENTNWFLEVGQKNEPSSRENFWDGGILLVSGWTGKAVQLLSHKLASIFTKTNANVHPFWSNIIVCTLTLQFGLSINNRIECRPNPFEISELYVETLRPETDVGKIWNNWGDIYLDHMTWKFSLASLQIFLQFTLSFSHPTLPIHMYLFSSSLEFSVKFHFHFPQPC